MRHGGVWGGGTHFPTVRPARANQLFGWGGEGLKQDFFYEYTDVNFYFNHATSQTNAALDISFFRKLREHTSYMGQRNEED